MNVGMLELTPSPSDPVTFVTQHPELTPSPLVASW
jgi:hypothetical protein